MTTYAGPPVFPQYFVDPLGKPLRSVKITVYERGTDTKPDLYADREKSTPLGNPFWATSLGNAEFRVDALGEFEAEVNGVRVPFTVVADPEEPVTIGAGVIEEAMLEFGVATQVELDAVAAAAAAGDTSLAGAVEAVQEALAGKATPAQIDAAIAALSGTYVPGDPVLALGPYDADGNPLEVVENGITTVFTYNPDGSVATSQRGTGPVRTYTYDASQNLTAVA
jgi:YD repeat-containing protein